MLSMPFTTVLNLFLLFLFLVFWLLAFFIIYHLTRFGIGVFPKRLGALFLGGAVVLSSAAFLTYSAIDLNLLLA
jgi:hypothetical protein